MLTIRLLNLSFYSYHGVHDEEKKLGGEYEVNIAVSFPEKNNPVLHINETVDYVSVYALIKQHMDQPRQLLETIATTFAKDVFEQFSEVEAIEITITKKHPPIPRFTGSVAVTYSAAINR